MARLYGKRIMLREYRRDDFSAMRRWVNDPEVTNLLSDVFLYAHSEPATTAFLEGAMAGGSDHKGFVIADLQTESYIGQIDLFRLDWKNRSAELGLVIGVKELFGQGYGTEAIRLMQSFVFYRMNLRRLYLQVHDYNTRAYQCYLKCGFREEGRLREAHYYNGRYHDIILMSVLRNDVMQGMGV